MRRCRLVGPAVLVAMLAASAGLASAASAALAPGYGPVGNFDPGGIGGSQGTGHVAVDNATGNVLLADPENSRVIVMAPDLAPGGTLTTSTEFFATAGNGLAVDQATHAVYVSEGSPGNQIQRFISDGALVPTYTVDPTFVSPLLLSYGGALAVDPTTDDLLVVDGLTVKRFTSAGVFVRSIDGTGSPLGTFDRILDLAVGVSATYVVDLRDGTGSPYAGDALSRIVQYDSQGSYVRTTQVTDTPTAAGVQPSLDRLLAVGNTGSAQGGAQLSQYSDGIATGIGPNAAAAGSYVIGVAADGGPSQRAYVAVSGPDNGVHVFTPGPGSRSDSFTTSDPRSAHLTGLVNPEGKTTMAHFEYCSQRDPCATDASVAWTTAPASDISIGSGSSDVAIATDIADLIPHTKYSVRVVATDPATSDRSPTATVTTADQAPIVTTAGVSDLSDVDATVTGSVVGLGVQTTYYFEYGETTSYGARVPALDGTGIAGNGYVARLVNRQISGLTPGAAYHYRLVAVNSAGRTAGADQTFRTRGSADRRAYELVSPADKHGVRVDTKYGGIRVSANGDALMYGTEKVALPQAQAATFLPRVMATRSVNGWSNATLDLPMENLKGGDLLFYSTLAVSGDVRRALVLSRSKLTDEAVQGGWNLYIREPGAEPEFTFVASDPVLSILSTQDSPFHLIGTSDDLRTMVFTDGSTVYAAVVDGGVSIVSRLPDGTLAPPPVAPAGSAFTDAHQVSDDGSRIYFSIGAGGGPLYLRVNGNTTIPISVSHRPGAPTTPVSAGFIGASPDGRYVEFTTYCGGCPVDGLTPSAPDDAGIYRYDIVGGDLKFLAPDPGITNTRVPRPEANAIFFQTPDYVLHYAHEGSVTDIATLGEYSNLLRASDNGRYLVVATSSKLTSYDNNGQRELYRYDSLTSDLACVSCRTDGGAPSGDVQLASPSTNESPLARYKPRVILDDGTAYFDTTDPLVGADTNGTRDVYAYHNGRAELISRGTLPTSSQFEEVSADGLNVFFTTDDQLVGQDHDTSVDMYNARVGGGFAPPVARPAPCTSSECREAGTGPVSSDSLLSEGTHQAAFKRTATPKTKVSISASSINATTLRLVVRVSGRGQIHVSGSRVQATSRTATQAGKYTLKVPLSRKTRAARKAHHKLVVAVKVAFAPPFAATATAMLSRTLGK